MPPGADAWTLGDLVIVRPRAAASAHLLVHELQHVDQYRRQGVVAFLGRYLADYLGLRLRGWPHRAAYRRLPAEIQAEWRARRAMGLGATGTDARPPAPDSA